MLVYWGRAHRVKYVLFEIMTSEISSAKCLQFCFGLSICATKIAPFMPTRANSGEWHFTPIVVSNLFSEVANPNAKDIPVYEIHLVLPTECYFSSNHLQYTRDGSNRLFWHYMTKNLIFICLALLWNKYERKHRTYWRMSIFMVVFLLKWPVPSQSNPQGWQSITAEW